MRARGVVTASGPRWLVVSAALVFVACSASKPPPSPPTAPAASTQIAPAPSASALAAASMDGPPVAERRDARDTYFGREIVDPYRWMEVDSPAFTAWMKGQADFTRASLDKLELLPKLRARVKSLDNAVARVALARRRGGKVFYTKAETGSDAYKLFVRDDLAGPERLLVDPETLAEPGKHASLDYYAPSPDAKYVAFGVSQSGSELSVLHVIETATGKALPDVIDRARFAAVSWRDGRSFFYKRNRKLPADAPATERLVKSRVHLHELGHDPDIDPPVFGYGVSPSIDIPEEGFPEVAATSGPHLVAVVYHGVQSEISMYTARKSELAGAKTPWRKIASPADEITDFAVRGDDLFLLSHKQAPRSKLLHVRLPKPDLAKATVVVPESEMVLDGVAPAADGVYVRGLEAGLGRLLRVPYAGKRTKEPIVVSSGASVRGFSTDADSPGALAMAVSWTNAPITYAYDAKSRKLVDTGISPVSPVAFTDIVAEEIKAKSADGTLVPLSVLHRRDLAKDGSHPTWLRGYASYGDVWQPSFEPMHLAWLERGGVIAVCHARGGGEHGETWHQGGKLATKPNTIADFVGCARHLIDAGFTKPAHLGGEGTSAGGILIGGAIVAEPALFGAAVIRVGMTNALRFEQIPIGPFNTSEFGTVKTQAGFEMLLAIDAYHRVADKTAYPAVMLTTGISDSRVSPWQSAKMAARLQAATSSGKPVLLRVEFEAGHGLGSSRSQVQNELADEMAFLLGQLGGPPR